MRVINRFNNDRSVDPTEFTLDAVVAKGARHVTAVMADAGGVFFLTSAEPPGAENEMRPCASLLTTCSC